MNNRKIYALGFFDGVHLGHQALLKACRCLAQEQNAEPAAVTFDLLPAAVLQGNKSNMLNTKDDRVALLKRYGVTTVKVYHANRQTLSLSWQDFLAQLLEEGAGGFVCGSDYRFGHRGEGTARILQEFCAQRKLPCVIVPEQRMDGEKISSTRIRELLQAGHLDRANALLGHLHILTGQVVTGRQLGRTIGIPTANLALPEELQSLRFGVYACRVQVEEKDYVAVTNVGTRPTVEGDSVTVEAHLLDFHGDLYGKTVRVEFWKFLREEKKFSGLEELQEEILKNVRQTRDFFEKMKNNTLLLEKSVLS